MRHTPIAFCCICLLAFFPSITLAQLSEEERAEGFVSIFNGQDLTGWEGNPAVWRVENGAIVGQTTAEGPAYIEHNQFLIWTGGEVDDFVLRFDMKCSNPGNSGMQYRSWRNPDASRPHSVFGYQADFDGEHRFTGILFGEGFRGILCLRGQKTVIGNDSRPTVISRFADSDALKEKLKIEDWNAYEVIARGFTFTNIINGYVMSISTDEDMERRKASGILAIQVHRGPAMKVEVKNIRIKKLK